MTVGGAFTAAGQVSVEFLQDCILMAQVWVGTSRWVHQAALE